MAATTAVDNNNYYLFNYYTNIRVHELLLLPTAVAAIIIDLWLLSLRSVLRGGPRSHLYEQKAYTRLGPRDLVFIIFFPIFIPVV